MSCRKTDPPYEAATSFADGVEWCIACGLTLDQTNIMDLRVALQAARAFRAGLVVPERAMLPHTALPHPWRAEFERIQVALGAGVPTIAELKKTLPVGLAAEPPLPLKPVEKPKDRGGPKPGQDEWRPSFAQKR